MLMKNLWTGNRCRVASANTFNILVTTCLLQACFLLQSSFAVKVNKIEFNPQGILPSLRHILTDDLLTFEAPQWMQEQYPMTLSGYDDYNRPIWIVEFGKWDVPKMVKKGGRTLRLFDKYLNQAVYFVLASRMRNSSKILTERTMPYSEDFALEVAEKSSKIQPNEIIMIYDFNDLSLSQLTSVKAVLYLRGKLQNLMLAFEPIKIVYVLNVNFIGEMIFNIAKPILGDLFNKAEVYGADDSDWIPQLQKKLPRSQIPVKYGGFRNFTPASVFG